MTSAVRQRAGRAIAWLSPRRRLIAWWALISAAATITGPFGTYAELGAAARAVYWASVVGFSFVAGFLVWRLGWNAGIRIWARRALLSCVITSFVLVLEHFRGEAPDNVSALLILAGLVFATVLIVDAALSLIHDDVEPEPDSAPTTLAPERAILEALPLEKRGRLIRIEAQDHFLNVVTDQGAELIAMRLAAAAEALAEADGLRVHRSHWVMRDAVRRHMRRGGRDFLVMADGFEAPVGRSYREDVQTAALIPRRPPR